MFSSIGFSEIAVVVIVALLIFGPDKLPGLLQNVAKGVRQFQRAVKDVENEIKESIDTEIKKNDTTKNP
ncbi:MAG: twin-arginine translocase TatA/TatE family subunit [Ignavibacteriales bacterium]|nr:twin-arginine translocase TatA/TatE family subunit [Ignavibacteriales bacterium]MBI5727731.1 twin-arginine translocase TatA/TatE family subunit [Ignavibacteriales bacterium]